MSNKSRSPKASHLPSVSEDKDGVEIEEAAREEPKNEAFVVEIFLDEDHQVTSTQVLHVKRNEGETWAGWDERRLIGFLAQHAGIEYDEPVTSKSTAEPVHATKAREPEVEVAVQGLAIVRQGGDQPATLLSSGESFDVKMAVSVRGRVPGHGLGYTAGAYARRAKNRTRIDLGEINGRLRANQDAIVIAAPRKELQAGSYTVSAYLLLSALEKGSQSHRLGPFLTSSALEVR